MHILTAMKLPGAAIDPDRLIIQSHEERREVCKKLGVACLIDTGYRAPMKDKAEPEWKCDHLKLFTMFEMEHVWPLQDPSMFHAIIQSLGAIPWDIKTWTDMVCVAE